jgi:hypothetical protein
MKRTIIASLLMLGGMLNAAHADGWVFRDTLRPNGHARSMAAKRADGRKCGASHNMFTAGGPFEQCMLARGWVFDHVIPDPPLVHVRNSSSDHTPPIEVQSNDDWVRRQLDQDNIQQMINQQNLNNIQQMNTDQFNQQQQMINTTVCRISSPLVIPGRAFGRQLPT